jgi:fused signal recognition particle receptor
LQELEKIKRVITKQNENAPHEVMLVLDGGAGQNATNQAKEFNKAVVSYFYIFPYYKIPFCD